MIDWQPHPRARRPQAMRLRTFLIGVGLYIVVMMAIGMAWRLVWAALHGTPTP